MTGLENIEILARDHKPYPESANVADVCFYWTMRGVYDSYASKRLSREQAKSAKRAAVIAHERFALALHNALESHKYRESAVRCIGSIMTDLHKADTIEEKYMIALKVISALTGETVTEKTELRWIESQQQKDTKKQD